MESVKEKFLRYVAVDTQSAESENVPSTEKQFVLARMLRDELQAMGAEDVRLDEVHAYVYGYVPATVQQDVPTLGFIAHMDTSPALTDENVKPRCIPDYDGKDICLNEDLQIFMRVEDFPELPGYAGKELIVTDGTTLLGADDKAGVAEIMCMAEHSAGSSMKPSMPLQQGCRSTEEASTRAALKTRCSTPSESLLSWTGCSRKRIARNIRKAMRGSIISMPCMVRWNPQ